VLPTFVIGLREGLEASLIVGIVAAFLGLQGRRDALRQVWIGVTIAVGICIGIGIALQVISHYLPQRQQEELETVVGAIAVVMVTYMVLWMRRHAPGPQRRLGEGGWICAGGRLVEGAGADGVPGRAAGGLRDGGVPAGYLPCQR
jgi:high-affinity iron transporter